MEQQQFQEEWKVDFEFFRKDKRRFKDNWQKAYATIWKDYCAKEIQYQIEQMSDFNTKVKNDPLELFSQIETLMHVPEKARYPLFTLIEVLSRF